ncbi:hypothetical protein [Corynebacterium sp.]|uniref:hypothetical protein n=1 Tax=Corynebacterium sp. TaxID=1720 RepID=UPI0028A77547|nr:hypothetical protein [Corynebacterium sp.]
MSRKDKKNNAPPAATSGDQGGGRTIKKRWIFAGGFAVVIIVALIAAFLIGDDPEENAQPPAETTDNTPAPPPESDDSDGVAEDIPGAFPDNTQRHWPRRIMDFDDTTWQNPGSYATDRVGRPLWTPEEHDGDLPAMSDRRDSPGACTDVELEGATQQQYVNGRFLAVNEFAGPFKTDYGVPWTYAHSPQGAVMAAMNAYSYLNLSNRDEIGLWGAEMKWESPMRDDAVAHEVDNFRDINTAESPASFRIKSCSDDVVVVQVAQAMQDSTMPATVMEIPMIWKDVPRRDGKDWQAVMSPAAEDNAILPDTDTSEYTAVSYQ